MRSNVLLLAPLLALIPLACATVGDSTAASNSNGAGGETSGTASTSSSTAHGGASSGSDSTGTKSTGSDSTGTKSTGTDSTGSNSTGSNSTGSNSTGIGGASSGSASTGSDSTGVGGASTGSASTGSTGSASTGSASTGSDSTGVGGASTGSASTGSASTSTGGSGACSGYVDVKAPTGAQQHFASACEGAWGINETTTALGYHLSGGASPGLDELDIQGCTSANAGSAGVQFSAMSAAAPGTFSTGAIGYTDNNGGKWVTTTDPYQVIITKLDMPGGVIEGSFSATVIGPNDTKLPISGTFHVCRVADLNAP